MEAALNYFQRLGVAFARYSIDKAMFLINPA